MTSPEVTAGARAKWEYCRLAEPSAYIVPWDDLPEDSLDLEVRAFAAGLQAMLPVSDELAEISAKAATPLATGQSSLLSRAKARAAISAAIHHITSGSAKT